MSLPKIETPTFTVELPSDKERKLTLRNMKVREEKILLMAKQGGDPIEILNGIRQVVNNCIVDGNVDDIALFDLEYLFVKLRANSVSDIAEVSYLDNEEVKDWWDNHNTEHEAEDMTDEEHEKLNGQARRKATRTFKVDLNKVKVVFPKESDRRIQINDKTGIVLKYPPAELYGDKDFVDSKPEDVLDLLISKSIDYIYDENGVVKTDEYKPEELREWMEDLPPKVHNSMIEFFSELPHLHYEIKYKNRLGSERKIELTTLNDFFLFV